MASYVTLYDPKERAERVHKCDLPDLTHYNNDIWWQTIVECEECAQKWVARVFNTRSENRWDKLKWYHFKWQKNLRKR